MTPGGKVVRSHVSLKNSGKDSYARTHVTASDSLVAASAVHADRTDKLRWWDQWLALPRRDALNLTGARQDNTGRLASRRHHCQIALPRAAGGSHTRVPVSLILVPIPMATSLPQFYRA
jgi:hypothetical protein